MPGARRGPGTQKTLARAATRVREPLRIAADEPANVPDGLRKTSRGRQPTAKGEGEGKASRAATNLLPQERIKCGGRGKKRGKKGRASRFPFFFP
jgi:hypothetical protein